MTVDFVHCHRLYLDRESLFLTQKPEEEAVNMREWTEVKITWFDQSHAEVMLAMVEALL